MKKLKQLLKQLEEPARSQALANIDPEFYAEHRLKEEPFTSTAKALACAFDWWQSPEGYDYWLDQLTRTKL